MAGNWLPSCRIFENEHFLAAMGLSPAFPKGNLSDGIQFSDTAFCCLDIFLTFSFCFAEPLLAYLTESDPTMAE